MADRKVIHVDYLARVEGEGALYVKTQGSRVEEVRFKIFEPPRFFEAFLRGRHFMEAPDITARICGICPVAYQMSAVHAMEAALGMTLSHEIRELRRLLYCGEWIESHALHIHMLHAPDFLGFEDAIQMSKQHPGVIERGLAIKKAGNRIGQLLGGREIHPINVRVGGFYRVPRKNELKELRETLLRARDLAREAALWTSTLPIPDFERDYLCVALYHPSEYPFNEGRIVSTGGLSIPVSEYENEFVESHLAHTNALHSLTKSGQRYLVGPIARYNLNRPQLSKLAQETATDIGLPTLVKNPFQSILVRAIEVLYACDEAVRILDEYQTPAKPYEDCPKTAKKLRGTAATEAPRGLLYHRYDIHTDGLIDEAKIVPPTSQNQPMIEDDLVYLIPQHLSLADADLQWKCEQAIRNYDPCISCATHFLKFAVERK